LVAPLSFSELLLKIPGDSDHIPPDTPNFTKISPKIGNRKNRPSSIFLIVFLKNKAF